MSTIYITPPAPLKHSLLAPSVDLSRTTVTHICRPLPTGAMSWTDGMSTIINDAWAERCMCGNSSGIWPIDQFHKSHNALIPYPTIHDSEQKCAHFSSEWCIVGYVTGALWDLWDWFIQRSEAWQTYKLCCLTDHLNGSVTLCTRKNQVILGRYKIRQIYTSLMCCKPYFSHRIRFNTFVFENMLMG